MALTYGIQAVTSWTKYLMGSSGMWKRNTTATTTCSSLCTYLTRSVIVVVVVVVDDVVVECTNLFVK